jgi:ATP phosphoribosyltransferase regulatory subunit
VCSVFSAWAYEPVETPAVERYEALATGAGDLSDTAFRLFDADGELLALRPEMTVPIARLVASRMAEEPGALRFRYAAQVFREHESLRGQSRQFTQLGVELVGAQGPAADAEVIALLVEALASTGLERFTVALGTVAALNALVAAAAAGDEWGRRVLSAAHDRNVVAIDALSREPGVAESVGAALRDVVRIRGGQDAIGTARAALASCGCAEVLEGLAQTWALLESAGVAERCAVDFGLMRSFDYYTGLVLEAYAPGLGLPVGGGGRYDGVLAAYGAPRPAAGFALGLERLMIALAEQEASVRLPPPAVLVGGEPAAAFAAAARLRAQGSRVALAPGLTGDELAAEAARRACRAQEAR